MRILHILNHVQRTGNGIVNATVDLACTQAKHGHVVAVASNGGTYEGLLKMNSVEHYTLNQSRNVLNLVRVPFAFREIVREFQPEVVHAQMMTGALIASKLRFRLNYRLVTTVHNEFQKSAIAMTVGDKVIAVSKAVADSMIRRGIPADKIKVVLNGTVGSVRLAQTNIQPLNLHRPAIVTVAGMYYRKGIADLITAFQEIWHQRPDAHLYLVGDGPDISKFLSLANSLECANNIHFEGFQSEPQRYLASTDVFVLASHKDSCPLVLPEAREVGCAIVASAVDGIPEALDGGKAGILVPPKDPDSLTKAILTLINDPHKCHELKIVSSNNLAKYSVERVYDDTMAVYNLL